MIALIQGTIHSFGLDWVILMTHGVGYRIFFAHPEKLRLGSDIQLYTYHYVREDEQALYGFLNAEDYELFLRLISVKGLGCKSANAIFGASTRERLISAIEGSDVTYLKSLPGIGAKTASQIILDLKGKLVSAPIGKQGLSENVRDTLEALKSLGYKPAELAFLEKTLTESPNQATDELLKLSLKLLNQRKAGPRG